MALPVVVAGQLACVDRVNLKAQQLEWEAGRRWSGRRRLGGTALAAHREETGPQPVRQPPYGTVVDHG